MSPLQSGNPEMRQKLHVGSSFPPLPCRGLAHTPTTQAVQNEMFLVMSGTRSASFSGAKAADEGEPPARKPPCEQCEISQ